MFPLAIPASPILWLLVGCVLVGVGVGAVIWRRRPEPGALPLAALMASLVLWAGIYAVGMVTHEESTRRLLERLMWLGVATAPVAWIAFAVEYTGHSGWLSRRSVGVLLVIPAVTFLLVLTNPVHELVWTNVDVLIVGDVVIARQEYGPWFPLFAGYGYGLILAGAVLLVRLAITAETLYADQAVALVVGAIVPTIANLASVLGAAPLPGLDMTPFAMAVAGVAFTYAIARYRLFDFVPATRRLGRDAVVDNMRDAVVIVDEHGRIADLNPVAATAFDADLAAVLGEPVATLLGEDVTVPEPDEIREISGAFGVRTYELRAAPIENWQGTRVGDVLVFRDVTERVLRQQRLSVLNRILRHNLRNDVTVIQARANAIESGLTGTDAEHAATISDTASELVDLSEKARAFDRAVDGGQSTNHVDVVDLVQESATEVREAFSDVAIQVTASGAHRIDCPGAGLVEHVVYNLLENAAEHNDAVEPRVEVTVERAIEGSESPSEDDGADGRRVGASVDEDGADSRGAGAGDVVVTVADNGPVIPDHEREVLDADVETALAHGSGIGLWTASWCVGRLGGDLAFERRGERGNVVRVTIPESPPPTGPALATEDGAADA